MKKKMFKPIIFVFVAVVLLISVQVMASSVPAPAFYNVLGNYDDLTNQVTISFDVDTFTDGDILTYSTWIYHDNGYGGKEWKALTNGVDPFTQVRNGLGSYVFSGSLVGMYPYEYPPVPIVDGSFTAEGFFIGWDWGETRLVEIGVDENGNPVFEERGVYYKVLNDGFTGVSSEHTGNESQIGVYPGSNPGTYEFGGSQPVPEPASILLLGFGIVGAAIRKKKIS